MSVSALTNGDAAVDLTAVLPEQRHIRVLDGWRAVSIVLVLLTHLAPLGGNGNISVGVFGMAVFFTLSGFLITSTLLKPGATTTGFLVRRIFRILPLMWAYLLVVFLFDPQTIHSWVAHFLFFANLPPAQIQGPTDHLWSICVEMQFYLGIAMLFAFFGKRGLLVLPLLALVVTVLRISNGIHASSLTWYRVDEILAGCILALVFHGELGRFGALVVDGLSRVPQWPLAALAALSSSYAFGYYEWVSYARPYLAGMLVGATLLNQRTSMSRWLGHKALVYAATISYALYVLHVGLINTWLGEGDLATKYSKRPLLLVVLFVLAHLSTFHFERPMIAVGRRLAGRLRPASSR